MASTLRIYGVRIDLCGSPTRSAAYLPRTRSITIVAPRCSCPKLSPGGYVIVDDYGVMPGCKLAVEDFRREAGIRKRNRGLMTAQCSGGARIDRRCRTSLLLSTEWRMQTTPE